MIPSPPCPIPTPVKVYTLLTTTNRDALPSFVKACNTLGATGVTVFAVPQSFAPDPQASNRIQSQITELSQKESDAAQKRDYHLAAQFREEITALEIEIKQLQEKASEFYTIETQSIQSILATVVLDRESWQGDSLVTEESFPDQITHISKRLLGPGIRGNVHVTPLYQRTYIPLGSLQPVARMAAVPLARDSVVGDLPEIGSLPSGPQAAGAASAAAGAAEATLDYPDKSPDEDGIPNDLSPNQRTFVKAIVSKEASNFAQASNVAGLSPSSTKKVITDITKKWPEFPKFIESYISVAENE